VRIFKSDPDQFLAHMIRQAELNVEGLEGLVAYMKTPDEANAQRVDRAEKEADEVRRVLVDELNRTFITSIDREDIYTLSRAVDDLLDYAHSTVEEMKVLKVAPDKHLQRMSELALEAGRELHMALKHLEAHPNLSNDHARRAKRAENEMEKAYRAALAELFNGPATPENIVCMLKQREVYRHLSNAADRADEAADVISNIVVKMT